MTRRYWMIILLLIITATTAAHADLATRVKQLTAPHGDKVGFVFIDLKSGARVSINSSREYPAASVAKVPVMACAFYLADRGRLDLKQKIFFRESDKLEGAGVLRWLKGGREYTLWNLMRLMITLSDNTATRLVVNSIGLPTVEAYLKNSGLVNSRIIDPTMLVEPPAPANNLTTPDDLANALVNIYNGRGVSKESAKQMIAWMNYQRYRWGIWRGVPPGTYVANKTGQLEGILNDVGIVYTKKGDYVLSIFTWGFPKPRDARILINELSRAAYEEYTGEKATQKAGQMARQKAGHFKARKITKKRLSRRPSVKSRPKSGHRGSASSRKSPASPRR